MTELNTEQLIGSLARQLAPVRALRPPLLRSLLWLATIMLVVAGVVLRWSNLARFAARYAEPRLAVEIGRASCRERVYSSV